MLTTSREVYETLLNTGSRAVGVVRLELTIETDSKSVAIAARRHPYELAPRHGYDPCLSA